MSGFNLGPPLTVANQANTTAETIAAFLRRVLPMPAGQGRAIGIHYSRRNLLDDGGTSDNKAIPGRAFYTVEEAAKYAAGYVYRMQNTPGGLNTDLYTCMSLCGMEVLRQTDTGSRLMNTRQRGAMVASKTLFADLDVKTKGYPTQKDALSHIDSLVASGKLPAPTVKVSSGTGVHLHWVMDRALNAAEWYALGPTFSAYLKTLGVHHDAAITSDAVRVLRLPGTFNVKDMNNPLPTSIIGGIDPADIPVNVFEKLLGVNVANAKVQPAPILQTAVQPAAMGAAPGGQILPASFTNVIPFAPLPATSEFSAGINTEHLGQPVNFAKVVAGCPTLKDIHTRAGANDSGVLWGLALLSATFAPSSEARQWAHDFSKGHAQYAPADTDVKFDQKAQARAQSGGRIGWPSCKTFSLSSTTCALCPKLALGKTPFHGARDDSDMPKDYLRRNGQIIYQTQDAEGNPVELVALAYGILDAYMEMTSTGPVLNAEIVHAKNPPKRLMLGVGAATAWRDEAIRVLGSVGVALLPDQIPLARRFFVSFIQMLQARTADVAARDGYGWTKTRAGDEGFAFGGKVYSAAGVELAPPTDRVLGSKFTVAGELAGWKQAADLVMGMNRIDLQTIIATAFAGPLVMFSGQTGVIFSAYSPESGAQKSSAMKVAVGVWGNPVSGMSRLDDTINHVGKKLGQLRHIPVYWDELTHAEHAAQFAKLGFALTLGTEKGRMGADTNLREAGSWATMLVVASNPGIRQVMLDGAAANSGAGINRMLEIEVAKVPLTSSASAASGIIEQTHRNYGVVGALYAETLAREAPRLKGRLQKISESLEKATNAKPDERFWILAASTILLGAALANTLTSATGMAVIRFDLPALHAYLTKTIMQQRTARAQDVTDFNSEDFAVSVVQEYISWSRSRVECLETDTVPSGQGRPPPIQMRMPSAIAVQQMRAPRMHIVHDDGLIRMLKTDFRAWATKERKLPFDVVQRSLVKFAGFTEVRARWAAGTPWAGASQTFYQIDVGRARTPLGARFEIGAAPPALGLPTGAPAVPGGVI